MPDEDRVVVVGAGISGLSTARALEQAGIPVTVLERASELQAFGGAITIWFNGVAALDRLGVGDEVERVGATLEFQSMRSARARTLFEIPVGELCRANSLRPPIIVRRPDLVRALGSSLGDGTVRFGVTCTGFEQDRDGVTVRLEDGTTERAAVLIVADGIDSGLRASLVPGVEPRFAGYQYLRAVPDFEDERVPSGTFVFIFGRGDRFGINGANGWTYWFAVVVATPGSGDPDGGRKRQLLDRFRAFPPPVRDYIEATPEDAIGRVDIRDLDPLPSWGSGRVTLIGDAAHATTPNMARGAGEAIEDAVVLARELAGVTGLDDAGQVERALAAFQERRRPATASVQTKARRIGAMASWRDPVRTTVRDELMRRVLGKGIVKQTRAEAEQLGLERAAPDGQRVTTA